MLQAVILAAALTGATVTPEYFCEDVQVRVRWYPDWESLQVAYPGRYYQFGVRGFAIIDGENCKCTIHALEPTKVLDRRSATVGHEFLHCIWGFYHK